MSVYLSGLLRQACPSGTGNGSCCQYRAEVLADTGAEASPLRGLLGGGVLEQAGSFAGDAGHGIG